MRCNPQQVVQSELCKPTCCGQPTERQLEEVMTDSVQPLQRVRSKAQPLLDHQLRAIHVVKCLGKLRCWLATRRVRLCSSTRQLAQVDRIRRARGCAGSRRTRFRCRGRADVFRRPPRREGKRNLDA